MGRGGQQHLPCGSVGRIKGDKACGVPRAGLSTDEMFAVINCSPIFQAGKLRLRKVHVSSPKLDTELTAESG